MSEFDTKEQNFTALAARVLTIEDVTWGPPPGKIAGLSDGKILVRFRGRLLVDSATAVDLLTIELRPLHISPILELDGDLDGLYLVEDPYSAKVESVFRIDETYWGQGSAETTNTMYRQELLVRFTGELRIASEEAYDQLSKAFLPLQVMPLLRERDGRQEIALVRSLPPPRPSNPWINLILFVLTVISVLFSGAIFTYEAASSETLAESVSQIFRNLASGIPFAVGLMSILLAHEFGHYIAGRRHGAQVSLPYFLPFPLSILGTLGAFIQLKAPTRNKKALFDIGAAGPLAGLVVAIPVLLIGLSRSELDQIPFYIPPDQSFTLEGNSVLYLLAKFAVFREFLPEPMSYGGTLPLLYWLRYFFTGYPMPFGATDVIIDPLAWAGWAGLLVTAINLIPAGQLDGGHVMYTLFGKKAARIWPYILIALVLLGFVWPTWWLWAGLIFFLGRYYAEPMDQITPLDRRRKILAVVTLVIFLLVFIPVPLRIISSSGVF
jgi:membrane-associated protease RseP (regulator of RpoE activity)